MCGRVFIKTNLENLMRAFSFARREGALGLANQFPRYNGAPTLNYPVIIMEPDIGPVFVSARWGLMPRWAKPGGRPPPINARREGISTNGMFKDAYRSRRCLVPIDGFFEWKDIYSTGRNKQPYAIALKSGEPFAIASRSDEQVKSALLTAADMIRTLRILLDTGTNVAIKPAGDDR